MPLDKQSTDAAPPEPTLDECRKLLALIEMGGVTAAAKRLGMEQSTLSRHLAVFKQSGADGQAVLALKSKQLRLTPKGESVLPAVRDLVRQYEQLLRVLEGSADEPQVVRLGLGHFAVEHYLPRVLVQTRTQTPRFALDVQVARGQRRILGVAGGEFDLAVVTHDPVQLDTMLAVHLGRRHALTVEPLSRQPFCVAAGRNTQAANDLKRIAVRRSVPVDELTRWPFVGLDETSGIRRLVERELRKAKLKLSFVPRTGTGGWPAAKEFARQGLGAALLPLAALDADDLADLIVRKLPDRIVIQDYLIHRPGALNVAQGSVKRALHHAGQTHLKAMKCRWSRIAQYME